MALLQGVESWELFDRSNRFHRVFLLITGYSDWGAGGDDSLTRLSFPLPLHPLKSLKALPFISNTAKPALDVLIAGVYFVMLLQRTGLSVQLKTRRRKGEDESSFLEVQPRVD